MQILVRGGQTTIHSIRMLKQVIKHLCKIGVIVILSFISINLITNFSLYDFKVYLIFVYAKILTSFNFELTEITVINLVGESHKYLAIDIIKNEGVMETVHSINFLFMTSLQEGIKYGIIVVLLLTAIFTFRGSLISRKKVLRGKEIVKSQTLRKIIKRHNIFTDLCSVDTYLNIIISPLKVKNLFSKVKLVGIPYPNHSEKTHTLISGSVGTGKTVLISNLIKQVKQKGQKAVIYDCMGVYTERFYDPTNGDILLNPLDARSPNWSLINECRKPSDFDAIAKAFIPDRSQGDPFWENAARTVFSESLKYLYNQNNISNHALRDIFFSEDESLFNEIVKSSGILKKILPEDSGKTKGSILSVMTTYAKSLQYINDKAEKLFSIREWIQDDSQTGFLIISSKADQHESLKPIISAQLEIATNNLLSLKQNRSRRIWMFLDEIPSMNYIPSLQPGLSQSRQFGGSFVIALQLMAQMRSIYGRDTAEAISGSCRNRVIFATPDEETAKWCSNSLGRIETEEIKVGSSYGSHEMRDGVNLSTHTQINNIVLPTEIMNLENLNCYIKFGEGFPVCKHKIKYEEYSEISERFVEIKTTSHEESLSITQEKEEANPPIIKPIDDFEFLENTPTKSDNGNDTNDNYDSF